VAINGLDAVRKAESLRPDVILMDLEMPVLDGYEATRQLKTLNPACRVVVLTIHGDPKARQKAAEAGVDAFIVKGTPVETLVKVITKSKE
jgi:DNA-binding NarL/FixJ family response regulator